jgi:acetyltransferase-like isoleucine patch superfamily enzyme
MIKKIINQIIRVFNRELQKIVIAIKYNDFTIADYFRKQGAKIGTGCFFGIRNLGTEPYLIKLGNNVAVAAGVKFHTHDGGTWIFRGEMPGLRVFGPIIIEDNCIIGSNAQILPNVRIGQNSIISPGSVVISDIPANSIAIGIPARRFGSIEKYREKCIALWEKQAPEEFSSGNVRQYGMARDQKKIVKTLESHLLKVFKDDLS